MYNLECDIPATVRSSNVLKLRSQLTFPVAAVLELLVTVQTVVITISSIKFFMVAYASATCALSSVAIALKVW